MRRIIAVACLSLVSISSVALAGDRGRDRYRDGYAIDRNSRSSYSQGRWNSRDRYDDRRNTSRYDDRYNDYRYNDNRYNDRDRSVGASVGIVAGTTGAGAIVGALAGGKKGAAIGAITGGAAGIIYDQATRNNDNNRNRRWRR